jgi:uncharacterized protein YjbI with pentapeptide repeats
MNESNSKPEKPEKERRYDPELLKKGLRCDLDQYEMLRRCSAKKDVTEWNEWRHGNPEDDILLEGANLSSLYLRGSLFDTGEFTNFSGQVCLNAADFRDTRLEKARFHHARLKGANLWGVFLRKADMFHTHLEGTNLEDSYLEGTYFEFSSLENARFRAAVVDGFTLLWKCKVNHNTDFSEVALNNARIDSELKQLLEYNVRRKNWEEWYPKQNWLLAWVVRKFWHISDYGISTKQIIKTFFTWALIFTSIYLAWGLIDYHLVCNKDYPGIVSNLFVLEDSKQAVPGWLVPLRAVYFSIVTMTTLGLGDMYANAHSLFRGIFGHILLALQVTLGYVLLGALVTRFAVLFTAGGPAGKFADEQHAKTVA